MTALTSARDGWAERMREGHARTIESIPETGRTSIGTSPDSRPGKAGVKPHRSSSLDRLWLWRASRLRRPTMRERSSSC